MRQAAVKTKKELNSLMVAERKLMRKQQKNSAFMRKTASIFNGMKTRAKKLNMPFAYTLQQTRDAIAPRIDTLCPYCEKVKLTVATITVDHDVPIARGGEIGMRNTWAVCKSCNWQKGMLTKEEFIKLLFLLEDFPQVAQADIKRRLTIGGKWGVRA